MRQAALLVLCVLLFSAGDYFATRWGQARDTRNLVLALLVGPIAYLVFGYIAASGTLGRSAALVGSGVVLTTILAGVILLGERPDRTTWIAFALIVAGLVLLGFGRMNATPSQD